MSGDQFTLGKYTVRIRLRPDNPAFVRYQIFIGQRFIGNQFSFPGVSDCEWLERNAGVYATSSAPLSTVPPSVKQERAKRKAPA